MSKFPGILFAVLLFAASVLYGAVTPEQLKAQSAPVTAEKYPNADSVLLFDFQSSVYQADGTAVETDDFYQKVLTETGRRDMRELTFRFNTTYEALEVPVLEVIKPDGQGREGSTSGPTAASRSSPPRWGRTSTIRPTSCWR